MCGRRWADGPSGDVLRSPVNGLGLGLFAGSARKDFSANPRSGTRPAEVPRQVSFSVGCNQRQDVNLKLFVYLFTIPEC